MKKIISVILISTFIITGCDKGKTNIIENTNNKKVKNYIKSSIK